MDVLVFIFIHVVVPIMGIALFFKTLNKYKPSEMAELYAIKLFFTFGCLGVQLILLLTSLFWNWSGMASLGTAVLIFVAPFIMGAFAYHSYKRREIVGERILLRLSMIYFAGLVFLFVMSYSMTYW